MKTLIQVMLICSWLVFFDAGKFSQICGKSSTLVGSTHMATVHDARKTGTSSEFEPHWCNFMQLQAKCFALVSARP